MRFINVFKCPFNLFGSDGLSGERPERYRVGYNHLRVGLLNPTCSELVRRASKLGRPKLTCRKARIES